MKNFDAIVIVDMQPTFAPAVNDKISDSIIRTIDKTDCPVFVLEYYGAGETIHKIKNSLKHKEHFYRQKFSNDGSSELVEMFENVISQPKDILFTGVNINCCVLDTMIGLKGIYRYNPYLSFFGSNVQCPYGMEHDRSYCDPCRDRAFDEVMAMMPETEMFYE